MSGATQPIQIDHEESEGRGGFYLERDDVRLAELTYSRAGEKLIIIDHTLVDEQLRGLGVARRLLDTAVAWARSTGTRVRATCPYALREFQKDASIRDVFDA
jgi:uncharacterized protein